jgi:hypothetical protein
MKKFLKITFTCIIVLLLLAQLYPRPEKNQGSMKGPNEISSVHTVPDDVQKILQTSCYDCHSNQTIYPWYSHIQPVASWLGNHIREGKDELNFSEFGTYSLRRQYHKLEEINDEIKHDAMPLLSYTLIHTDAKLNDASKKLVFNWVASLLDSFSTHYPADSLVRKKR